MHSLACSLPVHPHQETYNSFDKKVMSLELLYMQIPAVHGLLATAHGCIVCVLKLRQSHWNDDACTNK